MNFEHFSSLIEQNKVEIIRNKYGENYVLMTIINLLSIESINFNAFQYDDVISVFSNLEDAITDEDISGEIAIDPNHPYSQILGLGAKISQMEYVPKERIPSPFMFL